jgi:hypothetical protein
MRLRYNREFKRSVIAELDGGSKPAMRQATHTSRSCPSLPKLLSHQRCKAASLPPCSPRACGRERHCSQIRASSCLTDQDPFLLKMVNSDKYT